MAAVNKIEKFNLSDRVLALSGQGKTTHEISDIITKEAEGKYRVSQPTVSRYLKSIRQERSEQTRQLVHEHIKEHVPHDLQALEDLEAEYLHIFNSKKEPSVESGEEPEKLEYAFDLKERMSAGDRIVKIIETKLRYAGILEDPEGAGHDAADPINLDDFRADTPEKEAVNG
jgi:hypothetical protein